MYEKEYAWGCDYKFKTFTEMAEPSMKFITLLKPIFHSWVIQILSKQEQTLYLDGLDFSHVVILWQWLHLIDKIALHANLTK